jgi:hypothetical protein
MASASLRIVSRVAHVQKEKVHSPPSNETSSMSDVTDILCAVSSGDFAGAASSPGVSAVVSASLGRAGTSGTGESALPSCGVEAEESGLLRRERDERGRSACESGRGVISDASSKLSCRNTPSQRVLVWPWARHGEAEYSRPLCPSCASSPAGRRLLLLWRVRPWPSLRDVQYSRPGQRQWMLHTSRVQALLGAEIKGARARASSRSQGRHGRWETCEREVNASMSIVGELEWS